MQAIYHATIIFNNFCFGHSAVIFDVSGKWAAYMIDKATIAWQSDSFTMLRADVAIRPTLIALAAALCNESTKNYY